jgi:hypothetical protein
VQVSSVLAIPKKLHAWFLHFECCSPRVARFAITAKRIQTLEYFPQGSGVLNRTGVVRLDTFAIDGLQIPPRLKALFACPEVPSLTGSYCPLVWYEMAI